MNNRILHILWKNRKKESDKYMMFSPETYINNQKDKKYWELI